MRISLLILIILFLQSFSPLLSFSQNIGSDSLINELKIAKDDTNKVILLEKVCRRIYADSPKTGLYYSNQMLNLSWKLNYTAGIIYSYQFMAASYYSLGDFKKAQVFNEKMAPYVKQSHSKLFAVVYNEGLTSIALAQSNYPKALAYSNNTLELADSLKDSLLIAQTFNTFGEIYFFTSAYSVALDYFFKSLRINLSYNNEELSAENYYYINEIYTQQNNYTKANYYFQQSYKLFDKLKNNYWLSILVAQQGEASESKKDWEQAIKYFEQSLNLTDDSISICNFSIDLASAYYGKGLLNKALQLDTTILKILKRENIKNNLAVCYKHIGEIYEKMANYHLAITYFQMGLSLSKESGQKSNEAEDLLELEKCYEYQNNYNTALEYYKQLSDIKDSIINKDAIEKTVEMDALYNSEKKEKEIAFLNKNEEIHLLQIKKQSLFQKSLVGGFLLISILFFFIYRNHHNRQLLRLQTLRNKIAIDLHDDVGATLSAIMMFTRVARESSKETLPIINQIEEYASKMLESMADIVWTINPSNDNFEKIISRMRSFAFQLLGAKNIDFNFYTDDSLDNLKLSMEQRKNLYLIFKEATNNMVKYSEANRANFSITYSPKNIFTLLIRDNGRGFDINQVAMGNGLKNMKKRALDMGAKLLIESEPGSGTTIQLLLKMS